MLLIRNAQIAPGRSTVDITVEGGVITGLTPSPASAGGRAGARRAEPMAAPSAEGGRRGALEREGGPSEVIDVRGGAVLPGLHDHHVHLRSAAAALASVMVGPPDVVDADGLARALAGGAALAGRDGHGGRTGQGSRDERGGQDGWLRAVGYHESVAGDIDRWQLDALVPDRPLRVQHRSGAMWILNSAAVSALGVEESGEAGVERDARGRATGRLFRMDGWLADRLPAAAPDLREVCARAAAAGVTGFTEAGPDPTPADLGWLSGQVESGFLPQRLVVMSPRRLADGPTGGDTPHGPSAGGLDMGAVKVLLDDVTLPGLAELVETVAAAHQRDLPVAVHCVSRAQLFLTLSAIDEAGRRPGDRIEHGSVIPDEALYEIRRLGVAVVTNPGFVRERGDRYLCEVDAGDLSHLYRVRSLLDVGITVAAGTDVPFGPADPWVSIQAAADRRTRGGRRLGEREAVDAESALDLFLSDPHDLGRRRVVQPGAPADLCVLDRPFNELHDGLTTGSLPVVMTTIIDGRIVHRAEE